MILVASDSVSVSERVVDGSGREDGDGENSRLKCGRMECVALDPWIALDPLDLDDDSVGCA